MSFINEAKWPIQKVSDVITSSQTGFSYSKNKLVESGIPQLRPYNITTKMELNLSKLVFVPEKTPDVTNYFLNSGDVLFNNTNSVELVGKTVIVPKNLKMCFSNHISRITVDKSQLEPMWLTICLYKHWSSGTFSRICKRWIGQAGVNSGMLGDLEIPTPRIGIQRKIIKKIINTNQYFKKIWEIRQSTEEKSNKIIPSVLNKIFKKQNKPEIQEKKLRDLVQEKERRNPQEEPDKEFKYIEIGSIDTQGKKIAEYSKLLGKNAPSRARNVIRFNDVIYATTRPYYRNVTEIPRYFDNEICSTGFCVLRVNSEKELLPKYLYYYLQSDVATEQILDAMKGAHYPAVGDDDVKDISIFVPKIEVQKSQILKIEHLKLQTEKIRNINGEINEKIQALLDSFVDQAIRGKFFK